MSDDEIYHWFQLLSLHGQSKDALHKTQLGAWEYDIVAPLYKCNILDTNIFFKTIETVVMHKNIYNKTNVSKEIAK